MVYKIRSRSLHVMSNDAPICIDIRVEMKKTYIITTTLANYQVGTVLSHPISTAFFAALARLKSTAFTIILIRALFTY